jgi:UDPglucose 6-dehydrogenase
MPIYEPGLDKLSLQRGGRAAVSSSPPIWRPRSTGADAVFIAVGTPTRRGDGHADLTYVYARPPRDRAGATGYTVVVTKSTVPVGTGDEVERIIARPTGGRSTSSSNPEFLREGAAIEDFKRPDRVVIGTRRPRARRDVRDLPPAVPQPDADGVHRAPHGAELIKYAANAFLATKITFINEIADLCEKVGADVQDVARGIGLDGRIGRKFLHAGPGLWRLVLPQGHAGAGQDRRRTTTAPLRLVETVIAVNDAASGDGAQGHRRLRRLGRRQDGRRARPDLQAEHRRHARCALAAIVPALQAAQHFRPRGNAFPGFCLRRRRPPRPARVIFPDDPLPESNT